MTKTLSIICYIIAGFFVNGITLFSFLNEPPWSGKFAIMGVFAIPAAVSLLIGLRTSRFSHWQRDVGVVFLSAAVITAFEVLNIACMLATPELMQQFPDNKLNSFSDYATGFFSIATFLSLGSWLVWRNRSRNTKGA